MAAAAAGRDRRERFTDGLLDQPPPVEHAGVQVRAGGVGVNVDREQVDRAGNDAQQPPRRRVRDGLLGGRPVRFVLPAGREWALASTSPRRWSMLAYRSEPAASVSTSTASRLIELGMTPSTPPPPRARWPARRSAGSERRFVLPAGREWALALVAEHQVRVGVYERLDRLAGKLACRRSHR